VKALPVTLIRNTLCAALAVALLTPAFPAMAGERELKFLQSIAGQYSGSGEIRGDDGGPVKCRLTFKPTGSKLNYTGRCSGGGGSQSFSGSIRFDDDSGRWLSSTRGKTVTGKKSGSTLTFTVSGSDSRGNISSTMSISPGSAKVSFKAVSRDGDQSSGTIPFRRG
jgi:hypothetical protein